MIPILYRVDERSFTSNGIGRLVDCVSCVVTEERNGIFECEFEYPITGKFYNEMISNGGILSVIHDDNKDLQLFDIYAHTDPIDGIVTFNAHHISYRLANVILHPFEIQGIANVFDRLPSETMNACPFTFWTDKITDNTYKLDHPSNIRAILGGTEGSILDVFGGGDYEFDNFEVKLYANRGYNTGVTIRYGKNLSDIQNNVDTSTAYSAIVPYWIGTEGDVVYGGIVYSPSFRSARIPWTTETGEEMTDGNGKVIDFPYAIVTPVEMDFSDRFEVAPTVEQLEATALAYMTQNETWKPYQSIEIDFVQLWQTPEYANVAALQRVSLCDTVAVYFPEMGIIEAEQKVIKTEYNVLLERYDSMELGMAKTTLSESLWGQISDIVDQQSNYLKTVIKSQTDLITGGLGGHVVMTLNASGQPQEILIMDTDSIETAVNVIRMNMAGIGFSTNGYAGPFESAWTIDGKFNADFISTGSLVANFIRGGTLTLGGYDNAYGMFQLLNADGSVNFQYDRTGMHHTTDGTTLGGTPSKFGTEIDGVEIRTFYWVQNTYAMKTILREGRLQFYYAPTAGADISTTTYRAVGVLHYSADSAGNYVLDLYNNHGNINNTTPALVISYFSAGTSRIALQATDTLVSGSFASVGTKSRVVESDEYGKRYLYCYETPSPLFGDVGEGVIDETGYCYVFLDPVFAETIATNQYQVFLQKYGNGDCWIAERQSGYFAVQGDAGLHFGWELKAKQADYDQLRLEKEDALAEPVFHDYGNDAADFYKELQEGRNAA